MSTSLVSTVPTPVNEPILSYAPGLPETEALKEALTVMGQEQRTLPNVIANEPVESPTTFEVRLPQNHKQIVGIGHEADKSQIQAAIDAALAAKADWAAMPFEARAAIFLKAADLLAGPYRAKINAATMLGQGKSAQQAEIDAACELIDFLRFNVGFARSLIADQPISSPGVWNQLDYRPLDGFVVAITPFNFTAIGGNLCTAPALMGNTVLWKPARTAALSNQLFMDILMEAGLPPGVINLVHGRGAVVGEVALGHRELGGVHFTGSTGVFQQIWKSIGNQIETYRAYPRIVGETGGKDFMVVHPSADVDAVATAMVRGAFEYAGQKCSALSRAYVPKSLWPTIQEKVRALLADLSIGDPSDFRHFAGPVIDDKSFTKAMGYIQHVKDHGGAEIVTGGTGDKSVGYFIQPTIVVTGDPQYKLMQEEIFAPILTVHPYDDDNFEGILKTCDATSPYALTGCIFAQDRSAVAKALEALRFAAGNFYINDKPTGAVVGQQPFGGSRGSGTNDKAGSPLNLLRWVSTRVVKETFVPPKSPRYPHMDGA